MGKKKRAMYRGWYISSITVKGETQYIATKGNQQIIAESEDALYIEIDTRLMKSMADD